MKCIPRNHAEAVEATWCAFRKKKRDIITSRKQKDRKVLLHDLPRKECVLRECVMCGVTEYERKLLAQNRLVMRQGKEVHWKQWCPVKTVDKNGKPTTHTELVSKSGSVLNLLKLYINQLDDMSTHQFFKLWQLQNFNMILENIQFGQIIFVHDFQQNLLLIPQDVCVLFPLGQPPVDDTSDVCFLPLSCMCTACQRRRHPHLKGQESRQKCS